MYHFGECIILVYRFFAEKRDDVSFWWMHHFVLRALFRCAKCWIRKFSPNALVSRKRQLISFTSSSANVVLSSYFSPTALTATSRKHDRKTILLLSKTRVKSKSSLTKWILIAVLFVLFLFQNVGLPALSGARKQLLKRKGNHLNLVILFIPLSLLLPGCINLLFSVIKCTQL